jgi:Leucine-rich repeat (LRR) protein
VPPEVALLSNLRALSFRSNSITSLPSSLGNLTSLEEFAVNENSLEGALFTELGRLSALQKLDLNDNRFSGDIPSEIGRLEYLETLNLSSNRLEGRIPTQLGLLVNLQLLLLQSNQLTGTVPTQLARLSALTEVRIDDNNLTGSVPDVVCDTFSARLPTFYLDCGGASPEITCPPGTCCTHCCSTGEGATESTCQCLFEGSGFDYLCG